jgi:hypothetical protein
MLRVWRLSSRTTLFRRPLRENETFARIRESNPDGKVPVGLVVVQFRITRLRRATIKVPDHPAAYGGTPPKLRRGLRFLAGQDSPPGSGGVPEGRGGR